jgi:alanine or glycine:cation symporter, AGCS family
LSAPELYDPAHTGDVAGASLTEQAIAADLGSWSTSVLSNYVIAEANLFFLGGRRWAINMLKLVTLGSIAFGAMSKLTRSGRSRIWPWR